VIKTFQTNTTNVGFHSRVFHFLLPYYFIHRTHTPNVNKVNGTVVTTYTRQSLETTKLGQPGEGEEVPKKLHTKVAGRYNIIGFATIFMEILSLLVS
jgi:hypothetical protein